MYGDQPFALVENMVVDSAYRSKGVGSELMTYIHQICKEQRCTKVMLSSSMGRSKAHRFFERNGYRGDLKRAFVNYINRNECGEIVTKYDFQTILPNSAELKITGLAIREINGQSEAEIKLIAGRMRDTLVEVLGEERAVAMYSMDWLIDRVKFHLNPTLSTSKVFISQNSQGEILGHCIVRIEQNENGKKYGLFSTTYVEPKSRKLGIANNFLITGEHWMISHGLSIAVTDTAKDNSKLINLYFKHGYKIVFSNDEMIRLEKPLTINPIHSEV